MTPNFFWLTSSARTSLCIGALAVALLGEASLARAEKADRDKPINFQGDRIVGNTGTKEVELIGNVVVTQGTLTIHADRIKLHQNPDNSMSATAYGNPVSFREKRDGVDEYYEGFAKRIEYDGTKQFVELFDRALLRYAATTSPTTRAPTCSRPRAGRTQRLPLRAIRRWARACAACSCRNQRKAARQATARRTMARAAIPSRPPGKRALLFL
jgi:lipopolysaccharide transport protein LptA